MDAGLKSLICVISERKFKIQKSFMPFIFVILSFVFIL